MPLPGSALKAFAPQHKGFGSNTVAHPLPIVDPAAASPATKAAAADVEERRLRRRMSNRESARRSRARKQRHLDELRARAARLRGGNRELAARVHTARGRVALVQLANARLRAEAAALSRRLTAARRVLALNQLYAAAAGLGTFEQTIASLIV